MPIPAPTGGIFTSDILPEDLASSSYPKLIIVAEADHVIGRDFPAMAQAIYYTAAEPKRLEVFPGDFRSMELFRSEQGEALQEMLPALFLGAWVGGADVAATDSLSRVPGT